MTAPIDPNVLRIAEALERTAPSQGKAATGKDFSDVLGDLVKEADELQKDSTSKVEAFAEGKVDDIHDVMIAMTKADVSFRMMLEVRNKLVDAYQEVMRIQV